MTLLSAQQFSQKINLTHEEKLLCRSVEPSRAALIRAAFSFSNLLVLYLQNKNDLSKQVVFIVSVRFRYRLSGQVPARFGCIFSPMGRKLWSCRHQAGGKQMSTGHLHLLVQICPSLISPKQKGHPYGCPFLFWRYRPDLNWRMRVLQTLALPLGHGTINKNRNAERSYFI